MSSELIAQLLIYGLTDGAVVALSAAGFTLAYSVARQINLAHGSVFAVTTVVVANVAALLGVTAAAPVGLRIAALLVLAFVGAGTGGLLNFGVERLAFRPFRGARDPLAPLIASVALSFVLFQLAVWWHDLRFVAPPGAHQGVDLPLLAVPDLVPRLNLGECCGVTFTLKDLLVLVIAAAVAGGGARLLTRTRTGRLLRAVAQDPDTAALMGGDPGRAQMLAFVLGGTVAGFGAAIFAAYFGGANAQYGLRSGLAAMTAAVLGGVGDPRGALLGGIVLGVVGSFSDYFLDAQWTPVLVLVLLIALLAFRPSGLLGTSASAGEETATSNPILAVSRAGRHRLALASLFAVGIAFPWLDQVLGWSRLPGATVALLMVALSIGLTVVVGFAGLLDLGYAAFFAIGSYTAAVLTSSGSRIATGLPIELREPWLALLMGGLVAAGFGLIFGLPSVRTRGEYLAIVTLAFGEIVPLVIWHLPDWTGGPRGMSGIPPVAFGPLQIPGGVATYAVALGLVGLACVAALRLDASRIGRAWAAVREDDTAAASLGINPPLMKLLAFAIGAGIAGASGAAFAQLFSYVEPGEFDFTVSLMVLSAVVIGGRWGVLGAVLGALAIAAYDRFLVDALSVGLHAVGIAADLRQHNFIVFGVALLAATLLRARAPAMGIQKSRLRRRPVATERAQPAGTPTA